MGTSKSLDVCSLIVFRAKYGIVHCHVRGHQRVVNRITGMMRLYYIYIYIINYYSCSSPMIMLWVVYYVMFFFWSDTNYS